MRLEPLKPGSTIGIFGGGQLGRFLCMAAAKLGLKPAVFAPEPDSPAFQVASRYWVAPYSEEDAVTSFASACDAITFEFENVPARTLALAERHAPVRPPARAAEITQDRIAERRFLSALGLPVAPHAIIESGHDLNAALGFLQRSGRGILKRAREGYDGKGQIRVSTGDELRAALETPMPACVLEAALDFKLEISVLSVRSTNGDVLCYDSPENSHGGGILRTSAVPANCPEKYQVRAREMAIQILEGLNFCGVAGIEFFIMPDENAEPVLVNEIAPRVHNSGHWTLDACTISQFENHIRAVALWPLGAVERHSDAVMRNLLGEDVTRWEAILRNDPMSSLYLYGKADMRKGRKLGHVTRITPRTKL